METVEINDTTFLTPHAPSGVEAVTGDEKQVDFFPRVKFKKWDNECNYSFGLVDAGGAHSISGDVVDYVGNGIRAKFYPKRAEKRKAPSSLRWLKMDTLSPYETAAEYELQRSLGNYEFSIATYRASESSIMMFGLFTGDRYLQIGEDCKAKCFKAGDDLPVVRIPLAQTNPYYMDAGLVNIDIHIGHQDVPDVKWKWLQAVLETFAAHGIAAFTQPDVDNKGALKVYVEHDGRDVKVHSADLSFDILSAYINIECDYNRVYDYYSPDAWPDVASDIRDAHAYGLRDIYPTVSYSIVDDMVARFAVLLKVTLDDRPYDMRELSRLAELAIIHEDYQWVENAKRTDPGWHYEPNIDGHEFEIWLDDKPLSNIVELSMQHKNVSFHYQPALTAQEVNEGRTRWSNIEGSWAVYHTDYQSIKGDKYQTAKVGHIYRPWAEDASGKRVWCDLNIDANNNLATITLPQDFVDSAVYPIMIDPTAGYQNVGGSSLTMADNSFLALVLPNDYAYSGSVSTINAYLGVSTSGTSTMGWSLGIYSTAGDFKCQTADQTASNVNLTQWWSLAPTTTFTPTAFGPYWVGCWLGVKASYETMTIYYDAMTAGGRQYLGTYTPAWVATIAGTTNLADEFSVYIAQNAGGESSRNQGKGVQSAW